MYDYKELEVWQNSFDLVLDIYKLIARLPSHEKFSLADQVKRCSISIPSNIAEGHDRQSTKEFIQFLYIALGSASELETQLLIIEKVYSFDVSTNLEKLKSIKMMLHKLISSLKKRVKR
jgi:four helix bundle protein